MLLRIIPFCLVICFLNSSCEFEAIHSKNDKKSKIGKLKILSNELIHTSIFSKNLNRNWNISIYLPPHYFSDSISKFNILYLLHGHGGNHETWMSNGEIKEMIDKLIYTNKINDFVIVMPDGGNSWFIDGTEKMESAIVNELIPFIQKKYRIKEDWQSTSIGGMSAGGYGSLRFVLKYPDIFSNAILMSPASYFPYPDTSSFSRKDVPSFRDKTGMFSNSIWTKNNYPNYWKIFENSKNKPHHFYLSVGNTDVFKGIIKSVNYYLPNEIRKRKNLIKVDIVNYSGGHEMKVWKQALKRAILSIYKK